jgi:hypothetical protein
VYSDTMGADSCACLELNAAVANEREGSAGATHRLRAAVARMIEVRE